VTEVLSFLLWYLAASAAGLLALPLAFRFFSELPDRGYSFTKPLGLLVTGYLFWLLASLGLVQNNPGGILFAAFLLLGMGLAWLGRGGIADLRGWLRRESGLVLAVEAVFLAAFVLWAVVRAYNPNIDGTEKPMEFMFINSVLRSPTFPPHDAWLSGHAISYYYFGYVLIAMLAQITGTASSLAFNLGISLLFALTAVASLGMALNLIGLARRAPAPLLHSFAPALLAPLLVLVVGNYYGFLDLLHSNGVAREARIPAVWYDFGQPYPSVQPQSLADFEQPPGVRAGMTGLWEWLDLKLLNSPPAPSSGPWRWELGRWFFAARVVHDRNLVGAEVEAIDENPAFSFLLADMHPHVLALPFVILAAGAALEWLLWARRRLAVPGKEGEALRPALPRILLSAVILGGLAFMNTWDFPIYLFLTLLALAFGLASAQGWHGVQQNLGRLAAATVGLALLSVLLYLPFYFTLQSQAGGILPNLIFPTRFQQSVVNFGPVMAGVTLLLVWAAWHWRASFDRRAAVWAGLGITLILAVPVIGAGLLAPVIAQAQPILTRFIHPLRVEEAAGLFLQRRLVDSMATIYPALLIGLAVGLAVGLVRREAPQAGSEEIEAQPGEAADQTPANSAALLMALAMILTGALLVLGPEYVYLRDFFGTRMNTIFKFYFQAWTLWAIAGAFGLWYVRTYARSRLGKAAVVLAGMAILPGLVYLPGSLLAKTSGFAGPPTLDGMAFFARSSGDDYAAIRWLEENVMGAPVILEGTRGSYWIEGRSSRISMATGLPTLMGWVGHEHQWRGDYFSRVAEREEHIRQIYQERSWDLTRGLLDRYEVEYIVVGNLERSWYDPIYQPKFDIYLERVFESPGTIIYRYRR
jgi:YYY domain-containing protein